jgi:hypothetical protein
MNAELAAIVLSPSAPRLVELMLPLSHHPHHQFQQARFATSAEFMEDPISLDLTPLQPLVSNITLAEFMEDPISLDLTPLQPLVSNITFDNILTFP